LGAQALLLSRRAVRFLLDHWFEGPSRLDLKLGTLAAQREWPHFCHWPSLVRPVGSRGSTAGFRRTSDFKRDWRAPDQDLAQLVAVSQAPQATAYGY
jgi:hypothetical protein